MIVLSAPAPAVAQDSPGGLLQAETRATPTGASPKRSAAPIEGIFRIGRTGVYCIRKPCPWRGITKIREDGLAEGRPVWAGDVYNDGDLGHRLDAFIAAYRQEGGRCIESELDNIH
jgi:hypothetical protein